MDINIHHALTPSFLNSRVAQNAKKLISALGNELCYDKAQQN